MGLQSVLHLQTMLKHAQEFIALGQLSAFCFCDQRAVGKAAQADKSMRDMQPLVVTAVRELQRLCDELDFPDSASLQFHIKAAAFAFDLAIDFLFGEADAGKRFLY